MMDDIIANQKIGLRVRHWFGLRGAKWLGIVLCFGLFYGPIVPHLIRDWYENETFSYGFLIPFIVGYLVWERRVRLKLISPQPALWAAIPLFIAVMFGLVGQAIGEMFSMRVSMVLALASMVYLLLGREYFTLLRFPLFYLALMIPVPYVLIKNLTYQLRYLDAAHAANILAFLGIPVFVDTYFIHIPNMVLEVADVCSGVSSVFALFVLGTLYAYYLPVRTHMKVLLVACTFPFAMIANLIRIVVISVLAYNFGAIVFQSTFHWLTGTTVFSIAIIMLVSTGELLRRKFPFTTPRDLQSSGIVVNMNSSGTGRFSGWLAHGICILIFTTALILASSLQNGWKMNLKSDLRVLVNPAMHGVIQSRSEDFYQDPNAEAAISVAASSKDNVPFEVFVGYRGEQVGTRLGSPKLIFPDHWNSVWLKPANVKLADDLAMHGNWMLTRKGDSERLVIYWYQIADDTFSGEFENRLRQFKRALFERRTDGAVVRIATPLAKGEPIERAQERLTTLSKALYLELVKILP